MLHVSSYSLSFYQRAAQSDKEEAPIMYNAWISGSRLRRTIGITIPLDRWDSRRQRVRPGKNLPVETADWMNARMDALYKRATKIFNHHLDLGVPINPGQFHDMLMKSGSGDTLPEFLTSFLKNRAYQKTSIQQLRHAVAMAQEVMGRDITIYQLMDFPERFEKHMLEKMGLSFNTRQKYHGRMKTLIRAAKRQEPSVINPYEYWQIHRIQGNRQFLEQEELQAAIELYVSGDLPRHLRNTLGAFLFSCFTGLRYSDVCELTHRNLVGNHLHINTVKGRRYNHKLEIPIPEVALRMIRERRGRLFNMTTDQVVNRNLKHIMARLNINKTITFHCARHTFATVFICLGGGVTVLQQLLGHSKIETTMMYVKIVEGLKKKQIALFDQAYLDSFRSRWEKDHILA